MSQATATRLARPDYTGNAKFLDYQPQLGDPVLWCEGRVGETEDASGTVVKVGNNGTITVAVMSPDRQSLIVRDGVKHQDDPTAKDEDRASGGSWRHTPRFLQFLSLCDEFTKGDIDYVPKLTLPAA